MSFLLVCSGINAADVADVNGKKYYSTWSKIKSVKTNK